MHANHDRHVLVPVRAVQVTLWVCTACGRPQMDGVDNRNTNRNTGLDACDTCFWKD